MSAIKQRVWTKEMILNQGVRMPGVVACEAALGCGETQAYELLGAAADGDPDALPFPVIVVRGRSGGRRYVVATSAVLAVLGLEGDPAGAA